MNKKGEFIDIEIRQERKKQGKYVMPCPFHEDTGLSFYINIKSLEFRCLGCGVSGTLKLDKQK